MSIRFIDKEVSFEISELTEEGHINIYMGDVSDEINSSFISLEKHDIKRLRDFLTDQLIAG